MAGGRPKGGPKTGGGSRKGIPNKATANIKAMIEQALSDAGGAAYLLEQAHENPSAFMTLVGKILPKDVNVGGQPDNPLTTVSKVVLMAMNDDSNNRTPQ